MEPKPSSPAPGNSSTFVPLPAGDPPPCVTPERVREQLGWALVHRGWR